MTTTQTFTSQMHAATVARHADDATKAIDALIADMKRAGMNGTSAFTKATAAAAELDLAVRMMNQTEATVIPNK